MCVTSDANPIHLYVFEVTNLNPNTSFNIDDEDCLRELSKEIDGCWAGGSSDNAGWRFRYGLMTQHFSSFVADHRHLQC